jgi:hypothetical protein
MKWRLEYVQPPGSDNPNSLTSERKSHIIEADSHAAADAQADAFLAGRAPVSLHPIYLPETTTPSTEDCEQ